MRVIHSDTTHTLVLAALLTLVQIASFQEAGAQEADSAPAGGAGQPNLKAWFEREYETAAGRLEEAVSDITADGRYEAPMRRESRDDSQFRINRLGNLIRWRDRMSEISERVFVLNSSVAFRVDLANRDSEEYVLASIQDDSPDQMMKVELDLLMWRFLKSTHIIWDYRTLIDAWSSGDLEITDAARDSDNPDWVVLTIRYKHQRAGGIVGSGSIVLSPNEDWAIRSYDYTWPGNDTFRMQAKINVQQAPDIGVVPLRYAFDNSVVINKTDAEAKTYKAVEVYECEYSDISKCNLRKRDFELAAFGVKDPRKNADYLLWINITAIVLLAIAIAVYRRAKLHQ